MSHTEADYGELPDLVWVEVMKRLSIGRDRLSLSCCCRATNNAFCHPSLWHNVQIALTDEDEEVKQPADFKVPALYICLVRKLAHCFRSLTFDVKGNTAKLPKGWEELFNEMDFEKMVCLKTLTLNLRKTNVIDSSESPAHKAISSLLTFLKSSSTLKCLSIQAWPHGPLVNPETDIIYTLLMNKSLKDRLESLSLFWLKKSDWVTKTANVPSLTQTKLMLNHLCGLSVLSLRSSMLDSEAVEILTKADHVKLKQLNVLIIYSRHNDRIPEISSSSWLKLLDHSPKLEVECSVMTRAPMTELACILKPEVPLVAMTFLKYSYCDGDIVTSLTEKYSSRLRKLVDFTDYGESDDAIMSLVEKCKALNYLVYHRNIHYTTVSRLAEARGAAWVQFEFSEKSIDTKDRDEDTDLVIGHHGSGALYLKDIQRFHEKEDIRQTRLDAMVAAVRESVRFNWYPVKSEPFRFYANYE